MPQHRWKFVKKTINCDIYVDYANRKTRIVSPRYIYIHDGIYPDQDYESIKQFKRGRIE